MQRFTFMFAAVAISACGGSSMTPAPMTPSPDVVRTAYGLNNGSCWLYQILGTQLFPTISTSGPDTNAVAGKSVFVEKYQPANGGLPNANYFDTESNGEIRLLRSIERGADGVTMTSKRYDMDKTPPLFARFQFDATMKNAILVVGQRFEVTSTPTDGMPEHHEWDVLSNSEMVTTPMGMKTAYKLQYKRDAQTAVYYVVAGFGIAKFQDFQGQNHQVCAARVCDAAGSCAGADSCTNLQCPM